MSLNRLYSLILELSATHDAILPATTGHQAHALFLDLVRHVDPALSARLHDEESYRPFTVSSLRGGVEREKSVFLQAGAKYSLRVTLLDGGTLWQCLSQQFLEVQHVPLQLGKASFTLARVLSTPASDPTGWAGYSDWQTLAMTEARQMITMQFASPTAFSMGDRRFALFPEPMLMWDSLLRSWNRYAPAVLHIDKHIMREQIARDVAIVEYDLHTTTLQFPHSMQRGFMGNCTYALKASKEATSYLTTLAEFARFSGIGYRTTMGMGQARLVEHAIGESNSHNARGSDVSSSSTASRIASQAR